MNGEVLSIVVFLSIRKKMINSTRHMFPTTILPGRIARSTWRIIINHMISSRNISFGFPSIAWLHYSVSVPVSIRQSAIKTGCMPWAFWCWRLAVSALRWIVWSSEELGFMMRDSFTKRSSIVTAVWPAFRKQRDSSLDTM